MYVGSNKCWSASMLAAQWKDVEKSLNENNKKLKEIIEKQETNLEVSLEINEKDKKSNDKLLDISA